MIAETNLWQIAYFDKLPLPCYVCGSQYWSVQVYWWSR